MSIFEFLKKPKNVCMLYIDISNGITLNHVYKNMPQAIILQISDLLLSFLTDLFKFST